MPRTGAELGGFANEAIAYAAEQQAWYLDHRRFHQFMGATLRIVGLGGLVFAGLHSITATHAANATGVLVGLDLNAVTGLAVAGGAYVLDRSFGFSEGWVRRMTAAMAIRARTELFRVQLARAVADAADKPVGKQVSAGLLVTEHFIDAVATISVHETAGWGAQVRLTLAEFGKMIGRANGKSE
jgi:hypothetical protein